MTMSDKKYNYDEMINIVIDTMSDWFENLDDDFGTGDEDTDHTHFFLRSFSSSKFSNYDYDGSNEQFKG